MSRSFDILKLADEVLAHVAEPVSEKVASASDSASAPKTEIGSLLKNAAAALRAADPAEVGYQDIHSIVQVATKLAAGGLSASSSGPSMGGTAGTSYSGTKLTSMPEMSPGTPGPSPVNPTGQKNASELGTELRTLAQALRSKSAEVESVRATKAAHMLTAAIGLEHLTQSITR